MKDFSNDIKSDFYLSLIATQMILFQKLGKLLIEKGVITEEEYKELVTSAVDDIKRV